MDGEEKPVRYLMEEFDTRELHKQDAGQVCSAGGVEYLQRREGEQF